MYQDLYHNQKVVSLLVPAVRTGDANSSSQDLANYHSNMLISHVGLSGDTLSGSVKIEFELEHCDDNSTWVDCADADIWNAVTGTNTGTFAVVDAAADDEQDYKCQYVGGKRYVRVVANFTGTHTNGCPIGVSAVVGNPKKAPV